MSLKQCGMCKQLKPLDEFHRSKEHSKGRTNGCKKCKSEKAKTREEKRQLWTKYQLTEVQFNQMLKDQENRCAICQREFLLGTVGMKERHLVAQVDHDHVTGAVRGLLCAACNRGLGAFGDNIENLERAIRFLTGQIVQKMSKVAV